VTEPVHKLGEVLRTAREAKGVDLPRVERETKIRERYLSALERGEYRELPGAVYTKGFLRNYGAYLGLDPEYLIDLYRLETSTTGAERPTVSPPPRPLAVRRSRSFVVTPGAIAAAILTILVGAFIAYLGFEFVNFARTPELRITEPAGNVSGHTELTITVRGETAPNAEITFSELRENPTVTADAEGAFEVVVGLVPGSNVMRVVAHDPVTGRDSDVEERTIVVVTDVAGSPTPAAVPLAVTEPVEDATLAGPVAIAGSTAPGGTIVATAVLTGAPTASFAVTDPAGGAVPLDPASPSAPAPLTLTTDASGAFTGSLPLPAGAWELTLTPDEGEALVRNVTVGPGGGLSATLRIEGGDSWMELSEDDAPVDGFAGGLAEAGTSIAMQATDELRIRVGNAGAVTVVVNGIEIGAMGGPGVVVEWLITRLDG
jgi:cytoskeletal protein RodZ